MFALQTLGIDVDPLCTVQFSNHTGYPRWRGEVITGDLLWDLFQGLCENNLADYTYLISGYCRDPEALKRVCDIYTYLKRKNPDLVYVCDPVMGDNGRLYIPGEIAEIYKTLVIKNADTVIPNQTECEYLTDTLLTSEHEVVVAMSKLHAIGVKTVIITSVTFPESPDLIYVMGSTIDKSGKDCFKITVPKKKGYFSGTGDLFGALMAGWYSKGFTPRQACLRTVCTIRV